MGSKFFDLQFLTRSDSSDFSCKDGEIESCEGLRIEAAGQRIDTDGKYSHTTAGTAEIPPIPQVEFALKRTILPGWHSYPDLYPAKTVAATKPTMDYWNKMASSILLRFQSEASIHNLFVNPFFAMAVWKMTDGSRLSATNPQLLIPNSKVPLVSTDGDVSDDELNLRVTGAVTQLWLKMQAPEILRDWVGKIAGLEILVSDPVQSYNSGRDFIPVKNVSTDSWCESLDAATGIISRERVCSENQPLAWVVPGLGVTHPENSSPDSATKFYPFAIVPPRDVDLAEQWTAAGDDGVGTTIAGSSLAGFKYESLLSTGSTDSTPKEAVLYGTGSEFELMTRPLKLTGAGRFKRGHRVYLRGNFDRRRITISVYGSRDMQNWYCVARRTGGAVVVLPPTYFRFFKIGATGMLRRGEELQGGSWDPL